VTDVYEHSRATGDCALADTDVLAIVCKYDTQKSLKSSTLDAAKSALLKQPGKRNLIVIGTIEPDDSETLQRFKRGKKAFGAHIEDKVIFTSIKGFQHALCGRMKFLKVDTFFNRWPVPVLAIPTMPQLSDTLTENMFEADTGSARLETDLGEEDGGDVSLDVADGMTIPFPHEHHQLLTQEMMHVFQAEILVDATPGSGIKLLAVLLSNLRAVAICKNATQAKFVMKNLEMWSRQRKLVPGFEPLSKPEELLAFERTRLQFATPVKTRPSADPITPNSALVEAVSTPASRTPTVVSSPPANTGLAAFGSIVL